MRMIDKNGRKPDVDTAASKAKWFDMRGKGWVKNTLGPRGGVRWAITAAGVAALGRKPDDDTADEDRPRSYSDHWHEEVANDDRDFEDRYNG